MEKGYQVDNDFLNSDVCGVASQYAIYKHAYFRDESVIKNPNTNAGTAFYGDTFTESILGFLTPHVSNIVGKDLVPTYSYLRNWMSGEQLTKNIEDNNSDYACRIVLGQEYKGLEDYTWGIFINGEYIEQTVGGIVIYDSKLERYKEPLVATQGSYQIEMSAFFVENTDEKKAYKFDGRKSLGMRKII